jgi:hypothetical protein
MQLFSIIAPIDFNLILEEYNKLEKNIPWTEMSAKGKQCGLQYAEGEEFSNSAVGTLQPGRLETEYSKINPIFQNTLFEKIIEEYNLFRTRLMWVSPFACYSLHKDKSQRLHIPLITNTDCLFVFPNNRAMLHLPEAMFILWILQRNIVFVIFPKCQDYI